MLRVPNKARALIVGVVALGSIGVTAAAIEASDLSYATLALLAAAALVTELIQVPGDEVSLDPSDANAFSFSSGIHIATVLILGPWAGALVAAFGVLVVDRLHGAPWRRVAYNGSVFALAALAGGFAFELAGGTPGRLDLPQALPAIALLAVAYAAVNAVLISSVAAFSSATPLWPMLRQAQDQLPSVIAEAGLGAALAFFALSDPWSVVVLVPLVGAIYQAHARLAMLRRETARALETFANVVDERDASTYRHSDRVAEYVRSLGEALHFPSSEVARLRWAGRLHDLGKVAVDAAVLRKPAALDDDEWAAVRRHPRLSARLLRRFRFAAREALAVEYHHERFDGGGYYGLRGPEIPLTAHFLVVADSYDAMTSDRPYRSALPPEQALAELEAKAGTQFHPTVAKAFVALQRGQDPIAAVSREEYAELRRLAVARQRRDFRVDLSAARLPELVAAGGIVAALILGALHAPRPAIGALGAAAAAVVFGRIELMRGRRLADALRAVFAGEHGRDAVFHQLVGRLSGAAKLEWAGVVAWRESDLTGQIALEWDGGGGRPGELALTSWLLRDAEAGDLLVADGEELGRSGRLVALPIRRDGSLAGYLVLAFAGPPPRHVELALRRCASELGSMVEPELATAAPRHGRLAAVG